MSISMGMPGMGKVSDEVKEEKKKKVVKKDETDINTAAVANHDDCVRDSGDIAGD
jgi:hypothetical protein